MLTRGIVSLTVVLAVGGLAGAERTEHFLRDPGWDGHNNRVARAEGRQVRQDFGYSATAHSGGAKGEMGGFIQPVAEPAYYAKAIEPRTLEEGLSASGKLVCEGRQFNALVGFFNKDTLKEWRTANTIALRIYGRGEVFYGYVEYATRKWRAGAAEFAVRDAKTGKNVMKGLPSGAGVVHTWSLRYDPAGNGGGGTVTGRIDAEEFVVNLEPGHKSDGATFNRFGLFNITKHYDTGGEVWLDDITVNGETEGFDRDPKWDGLRNRGEYVTRDVRPWFNFGFSQTRYAGGQAAGELGGLVFRGDGRYAERVAFYGDRLESLDLSRPLRASGRVSLRRAVSDSDTLLGFFHSEHSLESGGTDAYNAPPDFLGVRIGGPSRDGFFFTPAYRVHGTQEKTKDAGPYIYPDGASRRWSLEYVPDGAEGRGQMVATLDGEATRLDLEAGHKGAGAHFNRFGIVTTHHDGNGQEVYFDDLTYTWRQE